MNKRDLRLTNVGISRNRYGELRYFCTQYPEWKDELLVKEVPLKGIQYSDMPKSKGNQKSQTEDIAIRCADLNSKCRVIEDAAQEAGRDLWEYIIKNVCYERPISYLEGVMEMPCDRATFYDRRRYFFYLLNKSKK